MKLHRIESQGQGEGQWQVEEKESPGAMMYIDDRWTEFKIKGKNIVARSHHSSVIYQDRLYVYGGYNTDKGVLADFHSLHLEKLDHFIWSDLSNSKNSPKKLRNHTAVVYKQFMVIFGGLNEENKSSSNIWMYDFAEQTWRVQSPSPEIQSLDSHAALVEGQVMYVFGGFNDQEASYSNRLYAIDLQTFQSRIVFDGGSSGIKGISPRASMSLVSYENSLWVFGGNNATSTFNDFWRFDLGKQAWSQVESENTPEPRRSHSMIVYEDSFWMFGGIQDVTKQKNDINIFTPNKGAWTKIMNTSNLVYECSPTMKSKSKGPTKRKPSPKKESTKHSNKLSLLGGNDKPGETNPNDGMKRIIEENKQKKFMERKSQLLRQFTDQPPTLSKRHLSPVSESMFKTLELIGEQHPSKNILHGEIMYDETNRFIVGKKPCARDAHSCNLYNNRMLIFGGDRHLMCFSDLYYFDLKKGIKSKILYQKETLILKKL